MAVGCLQSASMNATASPPLLIGCAAGFSGDRTDAAGPVVDTLIARLQGGPPGQRAFLIFETLAERTLALAQLRRRADPEAGYEPLLDAMLRPVLARCLAHGIRIVSNFGAAHPRAAARHIARLARELGIAPPRIAVVQGDDLSAPAQLALLRREFGDRMDGIRLVSANAYIGAEPIAAEHDAGAQVVVCGCYFADPGYKDVPGLAQVGFPIAEIDADGRCVIGKADGTGGLVTEATVKEQLLYEVHDPAGYLTPDVVADIAEAEVEAVGP